MKIQKNNIKPIPRFKNEDEERDFWATHSAVDYFDFSRRVAIDVSRLKLSTNPVTVRFPSGMLSDLRTLANKRDVPYQSLMKIFLAERIRQELQMGG